MNTPALRPVLATACLAGLGLGSAAAVETELQKGPDDFVFSAELQNKDYDQGAVRNDNVIARVGGTARFWDFGLHLGAAVAVGDDKNQVNHVATGEVTSAQVGLDYLIEMKGLFQIIPHATWITYPNLPDVPYKDNQTYLGVDGWYLLPWEGLEVGGGFDYNPFYNATIDKTRGGGGLNDHGLRGAIGARQFWQHAPLDLAFYELLNFGNGTYKNFLIGEKETGFTTLDLGVKYTAPFFLNEFWVVSRFEIHIWVEGDDRRALKNADQNTSELVLGIGFEWRPE
jgi:hypothetical protein